MFDRPLGLDRRHDWILFVVLFVRCLSVRVTSREETDRPDKIYLRRVGFEPSTSCMQGNRLTDVAITPLGKLPSVVVVLLPCR